MKFKTFEFKGIVVETDFPASDVPCGTCVDCCSKLAPYLTEEEFLSGQYVYTFTKADGANKPVITVPKAEHGGCMYFVNERCSIYEKRPFACKQFDCRTPETSHPKITNKFVEPLDVKEYDIMGFKFKFRLHPDDELTSNIIRQHGGPDMDDIGAYKEILKPGDIYIDAGANIGWNVVFAAMMVGPTGHVYAFEPEVKNYLLLLENIQRNNLTNVTAFRLALGDEEKTSKLYKSKTNFGDHMVDPVLISQDHYDFDSVQCVTLDNFVQEQKFDADRIKLVKIDTQGSDVRVLRGMQRLVDACHPAIIIEYSPGHLRANDFSVFDILSYVDCNKYTTHLMSNQTPGVLSPIGFPDLIVQTGAMLQNNTHIDICLI